MDLTPKSRLGLIVSTAACAVILAVASCGDDDDQSATTVNVTLREFSVTLNQSSASPGNITFHVSNTGEDAHEFLVIKTNLPPSGLPTEENGSYEENGPGTELLDEIELIEPGNSADLTLDLAAANYVLICNMVHVEDSGVEVHYALGMRTGFQVM